MPGSLRSCPKNKQTKKHMVLMQDSVEMQEREAGRTRTPKTLNRTIKDFDIFFPPEARERFLRNLSIRTKIMASGQNTSQQIDEETR